MAKGKKIRGVAGRFSVLCTLGGAGANWLRRRARLVVTGIGALGTTAVAVIAARRARRSAKPVILPIPGPIASETAVSVHNAAKATVIAAVREADDPDVDLVTKTVRNAIRDAAAAGADLTAAAIGAVEGIENVALLIDHDHRELVSLSARAAVDAAMAEGEVAGARVEQLLADLLPGV